MVTKVQLIYDTDGFIKTAPSVHTLLMNTSIYPTVHREPFSGNRPFTADPGSFSPIVLCECVFLLCVEDIACNFTINIV